MQRTRYLAAIQSLTNLRHRIRIGGFCTKKYAGSVRCSKNLCRQTGAQAVEFALMLPFLILIIFAVFDFGILAYDKAIITNASREASRKAVVLSAAGWNPVDIKQVACDYAKNTVISVSPGTKTATCSGTGDPVITVTPTTTPAFSDPVTVTVSYAVKGFTLGTWWALGTGANTVGSSITLTASTKMNHE